MQRLKDKMYNYEVQPPYQNWKLITAALDSEKVNNLNSTKKKNKLIYYSLGIAAAIVVFIFSMVFFNDNNRKANETSANNSKDSRITIPKTSSISRSNSELNDIAFESSKKYLVICGPAGEPVKISSKAAKLIVASDNQNPPKPVWSAKVEKWKDIMETNVLAPTTGNFLDIVELTQVLNK
jgi:hypothetical protein